jgi:hypothetical protein
VRERERREREKREREERERRERETETKRGSEGVRKSGGERERTRWVLFPSL